MAINFPILMAIPLGGSGLKVGNRYKVNTFLMEDSGLTVVTINRGISGPVWHKSIRMHHRWYHSKAPRQKVIETEEKAARVAEKLNRKLDVTQHEFDLSRRS